MFEPSVLVRISLVLSLLWMLWGLVQKMTGSGSESIDGGLRILSAFKFLLFALAAWLIYFVSYVTVWLPATALLPENNATLFFVVVFVLSIVAIVILMTRIVLSNLGLNWRPLTLTGAIYEFFEKYIQLIDYLWGFARDSLTAQVFVDDPDDVYMLRRYYPYVFAWDPIIHYIVADEGKPSKPAPDSAAPDSAAPKSGQSTQNFYPVLKTSSTGSLDIHKHALDLLDTLRSEYTAEILKVAETLGRKNGVITVADVENARRLLQEERSNRKLRDLILVFVTFVMAMAGQALLAEIQTQGVIRPDIILWSTGVLLVSAVFTVIVLMKS